MDELGRITCCSDDRGSNDDLGDFERKIWYNHPCTFPQIQRKVLFPQYRNQNEIFPCYNPFGGVSMAQKILLIEDEAMIQSILRELLSDAGYEVTIAGDGMAGLACFQQQRFDLVLLDIMLPRMDGYAVCKAIREAGSTPVIMLTALDEEDAQIKAFEMQADDYITKPFSIKLVLLRVEAVLRRTSTAKAADQTNILRFRQITLHTESREVCVDGQPVSLTPIEFALLALFMEHPGRVFTRENLLNSVWGYDYVGDEKAVNIHIMNLRRKLGTDPIETIRGVGYRLAKH